MLVLKWLVIVAALLALALFGAGQAGLLQGQAPADLGVHDGRLKPPSPTPNSVTSQASLYPDHPQRGYSDVAPLPMRGDAAATLARLQAVVQGMQGARVVKVEPDYLYAQVTTHWMKFVDDVEFWVDPVHQVVQVRSASRLGHGDMGVNRRRVDAVRAALAAAP